MNFLIFQTRHKFLQHNKSTKHLKSKNIYLIKNFLLIKQIKHHTQKCKILDKPENLTY